ncbi:MAG: transcription elongation factor GreA [Candidatus Buchananbacteria bacterium]
MKPYYVTTEALDKLKAELKELITTKRPEVIDRIRRARELGDLSENADYSDAKESQGFIEGRIMELENMIRNSSIINEKTGAAQIRIGTTLVADCGKLGKKEYTIVGSNEAAPAQGKISNESPFGEAFLGRTAGDQVSVKTPRGVMSCKIIEIK